MSEIEITQEAVDKLYQKLDREAEAGGYHLNPEVSFTKALVRSLLINGQRYGYQACPCRLAGGVKAEDLDIICPCDYRDPDLVDYGQCFCALYVSDEIKKGLKPSSSIPERRKPAEEREKVIKTVAAAGSPFNLPYPVWRCKVCGYLCARETPPEVCPICKVPKERFERFI